MGRTNGGTYALLSTLCIACSASMRDDAHELPVEVVVVAPFEPPELLPLALPESPCAAEYRMRAMQSHFPVRVMIDASMRDQNIEAALAAVAMWNREMSADVFEPATTTDVIAEGCSWVSIVAQEQDALGNTQRSGTCKAAITIRTALWGPRTDKAAITIAHELGHAIGLGHEPEPASLMFGDANDLQELSLSEHTKCLVALALPVTAQGAAQ